MKSPETIMLFILVYFIMLFISISNAKPSEMIAFLQFSDNRLYICVTDEEGKDIKRITDVSNYDMHPSWSPDGSKIAFNKSEVGESGIYIIDNNGENLRRLTNSDEYEGSPSWFGTPAMIKPKDSLETTWGSIKSE